MKIAILDYGKPWHVLASTSLIKGLNKKFPDNNITFFVNHESLPIIQYNSKIEPVSGYIHKTDDVFDFVLNVTPTIEACNFSSEIKSSCKLGFIEKIGNIAFANKEAEEYFDIMHNGVTTERHMLQVLYRVAGLTWKGEGYDLVYYPKNKTKRNRTGIAISHDALRHFVKNNLKLEMSELYSVPMKKDIFKRMDEINRCMNIITDDLFVLHASIALRKDVEFLDTKGLTTRIEFFGNGNYYRIIDGEWKFQMQ